jgi:exopolyphosphatase/guanosine-5'-triphosphate,3'-diphosphate pyrophosphatase
MRVAAVDIGSNSIKLLVAEGAPGSPVEVASRAAEARIRAGIGSGAPRLGEEGMRRGIAAAKAFAEEARALGAERIAIVATSAVRDASNGPDFRARVAEAAGLEPRILSGRQEAELIARGIATDPLLNDAPRFYAFDLGGGSLECIRYAGGKVDFATSLPLGCVRLTERFAEPSAEPFPEEGRIALSAHVRSALASSGLPLPVPGGIPVVGTGGTLTTVRAIEARRLGVPLPDSPATIASGLILSLLARAGSVSVGERRRIAGLQPERADVLPAALATLLAVTEACGFAEYRHSLRNLRWGVAAQLLGGA